MNEVGGISLIGFLKVGEKGMEQWLTLVQEIGFPIIVAFYLLFRIENKLEAIHTALLSIKQ